MSYQLSDKTIDKARQVANLHRRAGSLMIEVLRSAFIDVGYNGGFGERLSPYKFECAKELLREHMVGDDILSENCFDEYCRRARLALECNATWEDTNSKRYRASEVRQAHQIATKEYNGAPLTPQEKTRKALATIELNRAKQAAESQRRLNQQKERERYQYGDTVILAPLGIQGNAEQWVRDIADAYMHINLPTPTTPSEKLCYEFVRKMVLLTKKQKTG